VSSPGAVRSPATLIKARRPLPAEVLGHVNNTVAGLGDLSAVAPLASAPTRPAASLPCAIRPKKVPNPNCRVTLGTRRVRYVENWSPALDALIIGEDAVVIVKRSGVI